MSKGKTKQQKKKFYKRKENRGKVFKKKELPPLMKAPKLRERGHFELLTDYEGEIPMCSHGPCLLFHDRKNQQKHFSCAVYRDIDKCPFRSVLQQDGSLKKTSTEEIIEVPPKYPYGIIPKRLKEIPKESKIVYCQECNEVFENKHKHPASFVSRSQLRSPSRLLQSIEEQHGEAQYWFSDSSLSLLSSVISSCDVDGVLCMGSPRLFEHLRLEKKDNRHLFMLDWDERYLSFFPAKSCARYSLLVDHLPDPNSLKRLNAFFEQVSRLLIVSDPPFGVFVEPLVKSIVSMRKRYHDARNGLPSTSNSILFLPLFVGKHALKAYEGELWMSDYRVLYSNHKDFSKPSKTTVRMFTDVAKDAVDLSKEDGYRYCEMCEKWVAENNKHCGLCGDCMSRDGQPTHHCPLCNRCVKDSYKHCKMCTRCHLKGRCPIEIEKERKKAEEKQKEWDEQEKKRKEKEKEERKERQRMERQRIREEEMEEEDEEEEEEEEGMEEE